MYSIYKITNIANNKIYIGQTEEEILSIKTKCMGSVSPPSTLEFQEVSNTP